MGQFRWRNPFVSFASGKGAPVRRISRFIQHLGLKNSTQTSPLRLRSLHRERQIVYASAAKKSAGTGCHQIRQQNPIDAFVKIPPTEMSRRSWITLAIRILFRHSVINTVSSIQFRQFAKSEQFALNSGGRTTTFRGEIETVRGFFNVNADIRLKIPSGDRVEASASGCHIDSFPISGMSVEFRWLVVLTLRKNLHARIYTQEFTEFPKSSFS